MSEHAIAPSSRHLGGVIGLLCQDRIIKREQVSTVEHSNVQNQRMSSPLSRGTKLGRYQIRSQIGTGGMGEVYLAEDTELGRTVAIKILPEAFASDQQLRQRFIQEAKPLLPLTVHTS
ncbi:MAG TPA: hypothetical protein VF074_22190 [Pyrinomonadaceae bacterium]